MRRRTRLAVFTGLLVPSLLADTLDALAFTAYTKEVVIGKPVQLMTRYTLNLDCSGCDHSYAKTNDRPVYLDVMFTPEGLEPMRLTILSNARFVPPATGRLHDPSVNFSEIPQELHQEAQRRGCTITGAPLNGDPFSRD